MPLKLTIPAPRSTIRYPHFDGSCDALALAQLAQQAKPIASITASALAAQRLREEIPFFSPELKTHLLPDWETLPYDTFSPHHDLSSERIRVAPYQVNLERFSPRGTAALRAPVRSRVTTHRPR